MTDRDELARRLQAAKDNAARISRMPRGATSPEMPSSWGTFGRDMVDAGWDAAQSGTSGLRNVVESTAGMGGDVADLMGSGGWLLADKLGASERAADLVELAARYSTPMGLMPSSEQVSAATDWAQGKLPQGGQDFVNRWSRHDPTTPWGTAMKTGVEWAVDPTNLLLPGAGWAAKARRAL